MTTVVRGGTTNRAGRRFTAAGRWVGWLLSPRTVFCISILAVASTGRWRVLLSQLLDPWALTVGLALGVTLFPVSVAVVQGSLQPFRGLWAALRKACAAPPRAVRTFELGGRALWEEAFWRGTLQAVTTAAYGPVFGVASIAGLFSLRHVYLARMNRWPLGSRLLEFLLFSLVLGIAYALADRLLLVVGIHWSRNLAIESGCYIDAAAAQTVRGMSRDVEAHELDDGAVDFGTHRARATPRGERVSV